MAIWKALSASEQVAQHLKSELADGRWVGQMPGVYQLMEELDASRATIDSALRLLEEEGVLVGQGAGRKRQIVQPETPAAPALRVAILLYENSDQSLDYIIDCKNKLETLGHTVIYAPISLTEIKMDVRQLSRMVNKTDANAWVVSAGTREVLEWFIHQKIPAFAIFGRRRKLKIAGVGPDHAPSLAEATRRLIDLGHHRIVLLDSIYSVSEPGTIGSVFLDALSDGGITASSYNLPGWEGGLDGLYVYLGSSFQLSPPTAIIAGSSSTYFATLHFLVSRGIRVPQDLSLVCVDDDPYFSQCQPAVSHIRWSRRPVTKRIVRWVSNISQGKEDSRQTPIKSEFIEGGTIGPVAKE